MLSACRRYTRTTRAVPSLRISRKSISRDDSRERPSSSRRDHREAELRQNLRDRVALVGLNTAVHNFWTTGLRNGRAVLGCDKDVEGLYGCRGGKAAFEIAVDLQHTCVLCLSVVRPNPDHIGVLGR